jgi:hypothetical protein
MKTKNKKKLSAKNKSNKSSKKKAKGKRISNDEFFSKFTDLVSPNKKDPGFIAEGRSAVTFRGYDLFLGSYFE